MIKPIFTLVAMAGLLMGCVVNPQAYSPIRGSGAVKTDIRAVSGFTKVRLNLVGRLYIEQNGTESVSVSADDNILPLIRTQTRNGELTIDLDRSANLLQVNDLTYRVSVKNLDALTINGASEVWVSALDSESLAVTIDGAGKVNLAGKAQRQVVKLNGTGDYNASALESRIAKVTLSGLGKATVRVSDALDAQIDGAGVVEYFGNPAVTKTINGVGTVRQTS